MIVKSKFDHIKTEYCLQNKQQEEEEKSRPENVYAILIFVVSYKSESGKQVEM